MRIGQIGFEGGTVAAIFEMGSPGLFEALELELIQRSEAIRALPELASLLASRHR